jgi:hypothetical protein
MDEIAARAPSRQGHALYRGWPRRVRNSISLQMGQIRANDRICAYGIGIGKTGSRIEQLSSRWRHSRSPRRTWLRCAYLIAHKCEISYKRVMRHPPEPNKRLNAAAERGVRIATPVRKLAVVVRRTSKSSSSLLRLS